MEKILKIYKDWKMTSYITDAADNSMTVGELITELKKYGKNTKVIIEMKQSLGYYNPITTDLFELVKLTKDEAFEDRLECKEYEEQQTKKKTTRKKSTV